MSRKLDNVENTNSYQNKFRESVLCFLTFLEKRLSLDDTEKTKIIEDMSLKSEYWMSGQVIPEIAACINRMLGTVKDLAATMNLVLLAPADQGGL